MSDSIFPLIPDLQEQIDNIKATNKATEPLGRVIKYDFANKCFVMQDGKPVELTTDEEKIEQWIHLILLTYKDKFDVYKDTEFYCNVEDLIGKKMVGYNAFYQSEIQREVTEALLKHRYISSVDNFSITKTDKRTWNVEYTITLITGQTVSTEEVV